MGWLTGAFDYIILITLFILWCFVEYVTGANLLVNPVDILHAWEKLETLVSRKVLCLDWAWASFNLSCLAAMHWPSGEFTVYQISLN